MLVDETTDLGPAAYRLTQIHHLDGHTIRVQVHRDFYPHQSWARAEVLTPAMTWTDLVTSPAEDWLPGTPRTTTTTGGDDPVHRLRDVAELLTERARRVLHGT